MKKRRAERTADSEPLSERPSGVRLREHETDAREAGADVAAAGLERAVRRPMSDAERLHLAELLADLLEADLAARPPRR